MNINILDNGRLQLDIQDYSPEHRAEIAERAEEMGEIDLLCAYLEHYSCNGGYTPFDGAAGNPFVGLTSAPCIAEAMSGPDEDGKMEVDGRLWWFPDYAVKSLVDELLKNGQVVFEQAPGYEPSAATKKTPKP